MPKPLGVKANLSFGRFRAGKVYEIDLEDGRMLSLLGVGYLSPVDEQKDGHGQVDPGRGVRGASAVRGVPVVGSPGSVEEQEEVNVDDSPEPPGGPGKRKGTGVRSRKAADSSGAAGGEDTGPGGLASEGLRVEGSGSDVEGVPA